MPKKSTIERYLALGRHLRELQSHGRNVVKMEFAEIEKVIGHELPASQRYPAWWSNNKKNNAMTQVWLDAGFFSEQIDVVNKTVVFRYFGGLQRQQDGVFAMKDANPGLSDNAQEFVPAKGSGEMQPRRSPLFGALKGTFTIEPGYDLTSPMYSDEEWAEIEKEMSEDWDQIEQGMSGNKP